MSEFIENTEVDTEEALETFKSTKRYPKEFKQKLTDLYMDGTSISQLSRDYTVPINTIYHWVKKVEDGPVSRTYSRNEAPSKMIPIFKQSVKEETEEGISLREHAGLQKDYEKLQEEYQSVKKINGELQNKIFELQSDNETLRKTVIIFAKK